jgi:alpha-N-arabinofuranosidase
MNSELAPLRSTNQSHAAIHVAPTGSDDATGRIDDPLQTITAAAQIAMPGDTILIHTGIYREEINPPRGGVSEHERITYTAAENATVEVRGSELIEDWTQLADDIWTARVENTLFGDFNPYLDLIKGDWFRSDGRDHHTGAIYLNNTWLTEAVSQDTLAHSSTTAGQWFAQVDDTHTTFWAHFNGKNPNNGTTEINVRQSVFYPRNTGINYITVRGLNLRHAATNWAPPTAEQIGLIGTHWSKGWIIENNTITHSRCSGISLGKYGDEFDNTSADTATGYDQTIARALMRNWNKEHIGSHIVRNNTVAYCEQAGIVGSLGAIFSQISGNTVHDIHVQGLFSGEEQAGIKIHAPIDSLIAGNHVYRTYRGIWMDWMTQGTRLSRNLCYDNEIEDIYVEVSHGPFVIDHNICLSKRSIKNWSQGGAYLNNLFGGKLLGEAVLSRSTPYPFAHSTELAGESVIKGGDDRFFNNMIVDQEGLERHAAEIRPCDATQGRGQEIEATASPTWIADNVPFASCPLLVEKDGALYLKFPDAPCEPLAALPSNAISKELGITKLTQMPFHSMMSHEWIASQHYMGPWETPVEPGAFIQVWPSTDNS